MVQNRQQPMQKIFIHGETYEVDANGKLFVAQGDKKSPHMQYQEMTTDDNGNKTLNIQIPLGGRLDTPDNNKSAYPELQDGTLPQLKTALKFKKQNSRSPEPRPGERMLRESDDGYQAQIMSLQANRDLKADGAASPDLARGNSKHKVHKAKSSMDPTKKKRVLNVQQFGEMPP